VRGRRKTTNPEKTPQKKGEGEWHIRFVVFYPEEKKVRRRFFKQRRKGRPSTVSGRETRKGKGRGKGSSLD